LAAVALSHAPCNTRYTVFGAAAAEVEVEVEVEVEEKKKKTLKF
jgi:hypothetical protein